MELAILASVLSGTTSYDINGLLVDFLHIDIDISDSSKKDINKSTNVKYLFANAHNYKDSKENIIKVHNYIVCK